MADENLLKMAEQKFQSAAEKIAKDLIATCYKEKQTNADRFRAMSDDEQQKCVRRFWEIEDFADWLKQTAEGE